MLLRACRLLELLKAVGVDVCDHARVAFCNDTTLDHDVNAVDVEVLEDARVVRDDE